VVVVVVVVVADIVGEVDPSAARVMAPCPRQAKAKAMKRGIAINVVVKAATKARA
jgi:hypothetical protein